jgi:hypothetical protein
MSANSRMPWSVSTGGRVDARVAPEVQLGAPAGDDPVVPLLVRPAGVLEPEPEVERERLVEVATREDRNGALHAQEANARRR